MLIATLCLLIQDGPITVHEYMQLCVSGAAGYYSGGSKNIRDRNFEQKVSLFLLLYFTFNDFGMNRWQRILEEQK